MPLQIPISISALTIIIADQVQKWHLGSFLTIIIADQVEKMVSWILPPFRYDIFSFGIFTQIYCSLFLGKHILYIYLQVKGNSILDPS